MGCGLFMMNNKDDILYLIQDDEWMMEILKTAKKLNLPDWWICAGFVRSKIWDTIHGFQTRTLLPDIDVIYFDPSNMLEKTEKEYELKLKMFKPNLPWSVKNQARMHLVNNVSPYSSSVEAISKFPETATSLGIKLSEQDNLIIAAPCGIHDVLNLEIKPTPFFRETAERMKIYKDRLKEKKWKLIWENVEIFYK